MQLIQLTQAIQHRIVVFPVGHSLIHQTIEPTTVIELLQMAKLMYDYHIHTIDGIACQVGVYYDFAITAAGTPAPLHGSDIKGRYRQSHLLHLLLPVRVSFPE